MHAKIDSHAVLSLRPSMCVWNCLRAVLSYIEFQHMTYRYVVLARQRKFEPLCAIISAHPHLWLLLYTSLDFISLIAFTIYRPCTLLHSFGIRH